MRPSEALVSGAPSPVGHDAARAFDHRHQRHEVVDIEIRLDDQVDEAHRQQAVAIAVAAIDRETSRRPRGGRPRRAPPALNICGEVSDSTASSSVAHERTRIGWPFQVLLRPAAPSQRSPRMHWSITPRTGRPRPGQGDQGAEQRAADDERLGAVDRIEVPDELGVQALARELLAVDAVVRIGRADRVAQHLLGLAIGDGHRAGVGLALDGKRRPIILADHRAGGIREPGREAAGTPRRAPPRSWLGVRRARPVQGNGAGSFESERR